MALPETDQFFQHGQSLRAQVMLNILDLGGDGLFFQAKQAQKFSQNLVALLDAGGHGAAIGSEVETAVSFVAQEAARGQASDHVRDGGGGQTQFLGDIGHAGVTLALDKISDPLQMVLGGIGESPYGCAVLASFHSHEA